MSLKAEQIDKEWGYELIRVNNKEEDYCSKILFIEIDFGRKSLNLSSGFNQTNL